jgi:hypothetical protein
VLAAVNLMDVIYVALAIVLILGIVWLVKHI